VAVFLATQEAEIRRIAVRSQPGHVVHKTLISKKKGWGSGSRYRPSSSSSTTKKKKKKKVDWVGREKGRKCLIGKCFHLEVLEMFWN
jgi:hypothetical protein